MQKAIDGVRSGGMVLLATGIGLALMLSGLPDEEEGIYFVGAIPGLIGVALLLQAMILSRRQRFRTRRTDRGS